LKTRQYNHFLLSLIALILLSTSSSVLAQHSHEAGPPLLGVTSPKDDSVLRNAPPVVVLSFRSDVRVIKLRLLTAGRIPINLGFTYDPDRVSHNIVWNLPELVPSSYYIFAWAVIDETGQLVQGEFKFSVGTDALPPSEFIETYGLYIDHLEEER